MGEKQITKEKSMTKYGCDTSEYFFLSSVENVHNRNVAGSTRLTKRR